MVSVIWTPKAMPAKKHLVVHVHRDRSSGVEKGYFFFSDEKDWGGSGPFDMHLKEVIERAKSRALDEGVDTVIVISKP